LNVGESYDQRRSGDGGRFFHGHRDGFDFICLRSEETRRLVDRLLPNPDDLYRSAKIFKPGTRTHGGRLLVGSIDCFLKRYNDRGLWYRFRQAFIPSRAVRTWWLAWAMLDAGIPVPEPLVCLEERRARLLFRSYVLMRFASGCERLRDLWSTFDDRVQEELLTRLAGIFANMHRAGALHGDLKWDNILVAPDDPARICLVDLDGGRFVGQFNLQLAERDLQRFLRDLGQSGKACLQEKFMDTWRREMLS
jgi:tRNA A-37 threonylcarbamoyl transferase component Bud32